MAFRKQWIYLIALFTFSIQAQNSEEGNNFKEGGNNYVKADSNPSAWSLFSSKPIKNNNYAEIFEILNNSNNYIIQYNKEKPNKTIERRSDWGHIYNKIKELGINLNFTYTGEIFSNIKGGFKNKTVYLDNFDLTGNFNLMKMMDWQGASLFAYILGNHGQIPNKYIGSIQGISNIAAPSTWKLYQLWIQQNLFNDKISFLVGLYDVNSEFDTRETSSLFINPSQGIGVDFSQSGLNGPSIFPTTSLTLRIKLQPIEQLYIQAAVLDGVPGKLNNPAGTHLIFNKSDGLLVVGELGSASELNNYKIFLGGWGYTKKFNLIPNGGKETHTREKGTSYGFYVSAEKRIISEYNNKERGLSAFVRIGMANKNVNPIGYYVGLGFTYEGLIPGRDKDELGFALANAITGNPHLRELSLYQDVAGYELNMEVTYKMEIFEWFEIQPDFQYVINPGGQKNLDSATEFGIRFSLGI